MTYNLTNVTNSTAIHDTISHVNELSGGALGLFILFSVFMIVLLVTGNKYPIKKTFLAGSFITVIIAGYMMVLEWITWEQMMIPIVCFFIAIMLNVFVTDS